MPAGHYLPVEGHDLYIIPGTKSIERENIVIYYHCHRQGSERQIEQAYNRTKTA